MFTDGSTLSGLEDAFCAAGLKLRDYYYNWDAGHRYVLNLRDGESYTRYYRKLGDSGDYFVGTEPADAPDPTQQFDPEAAAGLGVRANGRWSFAPNLTPGGFANALYSSASLAAGDGGGITTLVSGQPGVAIYKIQGANVITSQLVSATFSKTDPQADALISISRNHGRRWQLVGQRGAATGAALALNVPLHDQVNGAYEVLVRIEMSGPAAKPSAVTLRSLTIDSITQVNAKALPTLNLGRNRIYIGEGDQTDTMVLWPELRGDRWQDDAYDSRNIASQPATLPSIWTAVVYPAAIGQDAYLTYRMDAPNDITRIVYGGRLQNFYDGSYIDYLHSFDGGATWIRSYHFDSVAAPWDVIHYETVTDVPPGTRTVLFKYLFHSTGDGGGRASGLYNARMEADHLPVNGSAAPLEVTWQWAEVQSDRSVVERSHKQRIASFPFSYDINVGGVDHPVMRAMRVNLEGSGDAIPSGYNDGTDVGGVKYVHRWRTDGVNLAQGRSYTVSRPTSQFQESAADTNTTILTDGVIGGPVTGGLSYRWGACWDSGADLDITIDLGGTFNAGAFRGHIFGWPDWDALKGEVQDRIEVLTSVDGGSFQSQGLLQTALWKKDVPINYMLRDDETATAWNFELLKGAPVQARYVRYHATPGRMMCVSELQVLDRVTYSPFDIRLTPPASGGSTAVWPFTVVPAAALPPAAANAPAPADNAIGLGTVATLTWSAAGATVRRQVRENQSSRRRRRSARRWRRHPTPALERGTTHFWQVAATPPARRRSGLVVFDRRGGAGRSAAERAIGRCRGYAADVPASAVHGVDVCRRCDVAERDEADVRGRRSVQHGRPAQRARGLRRRAVVRQRRRPVHGVVAHVGVQQCQGQRFAVGPVLRRVGERFGHLCGEFDIGAAHQPGDRSHRVEQRPLGVGARRLLAHAAGDGDVRHGWRAFGAHPGARGRRRVRSNRVESGRLPHERAGCPHQRRDDCRETGAARAAWGSRGTVTVRCVRVRRRHADADMERRRRDDVRRPVRHGESAGAGIGGAARAFVRPARARERHALFLADYGDQRRRLDGGSGVVVLDSRRCDRRGDLRGDIPAANIHGLWTTAGTHVAERRQLVTPVSWSASSAPLASRLTTSR
jgi:hypothetical protein